MNKSGKIIMVLLVLIIVASLSAVGLTYYYLTNEKAKSALLQQQLEESHSAKKHIENKLQLTKDELEALKGKLSESKTRISDLNSRLKLEQIAREQIMQERDGLLTQLNAKVMLLEESSQELVQTQERIKVLQERAAKTEPGLTGEQPGEVELGTIVVAQGDIPDGEILSINKKYDFVVINLGRRDGVDLGCAFSVYRKTKFLGDIQVVNVQAELSTANLLPDAKIKYLRKGDKIVPKK